MDNYVNQLLEKSTCSVQNRLKALVSLSNDLSKGGDFEQVLKKISDLAMSQTHIEGLFVFCPDEEYLEFECIWAINKTSSRGSLTPSPLRFDFKNHIVCRTYESLAPVHGRDKIFIDQEMNDNLICFPLLFREVIYGVLALRLETVDLCIDQSDIEFLTALANHLAAAFEHRYLEQLNTTNASDVDAFCKIALAASSSLVTQELLQILTVSVKEVTGADRCFIVFLDEDKEKLVPKYASGLSQSLAPIFYKYPANLKDNTFYDLVVKKKEALVIHDTETDPRTNKKGCHAFGAKSILGVPLCTGDRVIGVVVVDYNSRPHTFTKQEIELTSSLANIVALSIENSRLFVSEQRRRRQATALLEIATTISSTLDRDIVLSSICKAIIDATTVGYCSIFLSEEDNQLVRAISYGPEIHTDQTKVGSLLRLHNLPNGKKLLDGKIVVIEDFKTIEFLMLGVKAHSAVVVPLITRAGLIGVIVLGLSKADSVMSPEEQCFLRGVAGQAAVALQNASLFQDLKEKSNMLEKLVEKIIQAQEEERNRIAIEIHDETIQSIMGIWYRLQVLQTWIETSRLEEAKAEVAILEDAVNKVVKELRRTIINLRPSTLDDYGFVPALKSFLETFSQETGIVTSLSMHGKEERLSPHLEICLYRIVQESLTNVKKHAFAQRVTVILKIGLDAITLEVSDNGIGFSMLKHKKEVYSDKFGLDGIKERAKLVGGNIKIQSQKGEGTKLTVIIPNPVNKEGLKHASSNN